MDSCGECIGELVEGERRLVREHASAFEPEPQEGQLFVLTLREVDEPIDPTKRATKAASSKVLEQELGCSACSCL
jgi:hypothetical protein